MSTTKSSKTYWTLKRIDATGPHYITNYGMKGLWWDLGRDGVVPGIVYTGTQSEMVALAAREGGEPVECSMDERGILREVAPAVPLAAVLPFPATPEKSPIGRISACIAGDMRYSTTLEVVADATVVEIVVVSHSPAGGMDSFTGPVERRNVVATIKRTASDARTARELLVQLRRAMREVDAGTVARYGKPTKRFTWLLADGERGLGLSAQLAASALAGVQ